MVKYNACQQQLYQFHLHDLNEIFENTPRSLHQLNKRHQSIGFIWKAGHLKTYMHIHFLFSRPHIPEKAKTAHKEWHLRTIAARFYILDALPLAQPCHSTQRNSKSTMATSLTKLLWCNASWQKGRHILYTSPQTPCIQYLLKHLKCKKAKVRFLYSATYAAIAATSRADNRRKWQLIGKSQWCQQCKLRPSNCTR